ncbi:anti-repressor SinI family protein [Halobacillus salinarum]|uniref:Anti-repressor SinI family protein n=1 Tax=Halobacillus salinarum TaxID=2932257 RepID=A0ABY4EMN5_9BACI|nr:anti-repressor SinI family protein [Halobacillus salinarum]UOQ45714.1 anti-repressor SinI family protein [Halobacillus salinarum]
MRTHTKMERLDAEWIDLVKQAKRIGLTKEEIRAYLDQKKK